MSLGGWPPQDRLCNVSVEGRDRRERERAGVVSLEGEWLEASSQEVSMCVCVCVANGAKSGEDRGRDLKVAIPVDRASRASRGSWGIHRRPLSQNTNGRHVQRMHEWQEREKFQAGVCLYLRTPYIAFLLT